MEDWFLEWVRIHCLATGAGPDAAATIAANREALVDRWGATALELGEVTTRLVARRSTPKFPSEHCDAVGRELNELRVERAKDAQAARRDAPPPGCPACGGEGVVTIPHRSCVWERRIVVPKGSRGPASVAAICDRRGCEAGRAYQSRDKSGVLRLSTAERFHGCDLVALWRAFERQQLEAARTLPDFGPPGSGEAWAELVRRMAGGRSEAA